MFVETIEKSNTEVCYEEMVEYPEKYVRPALHPALRKSILPLILFYGCFLGACFFHERTPLAYFRRDINPKDVCLNAPDQCSINDTLASPKFLQQNGVLRLNEAKDDVVSSYPGELDSDRSGSYSVAEPAEVDTERSDLVFETSDSRAEEVSGPSEDAGSLRAKEEMPAVLNLMDVSTVDTHDLHSAAFWNQTERHVTSTDACYFHGNIPYTLISSLCPDSVRPTPNQYNRGLF